MRILVTGGAGFVGSSLCFLLRVRHPGAEIVAFDNLKRRGSEHNAAVFAQLGITFIHGDVRAPSDLESLPGNFDLMIEASAEPSVHAGTDGGSPAYLFETNLIGTFNCLEFARRRCAGMIFLSTSRVYAIAALRGLKLEEQAHRFDLAATQPYPGVSAAGIAEDFPMVGSGFRSLYGTTKLASELLVEEYASNYGFPALVNRCGVIAGRGQFGKVDQGVYTLWVARHVFGGRLQYLGFGGRGLQVRDLMHPRDLCDLIERQWSRLAELKGQVYAVGGGVAGSASLAEYTTLCREVSGRDVDIRGVDTTAAVDVPYFVTDARRAEREFGWHAKVSPKEIVGDIHQWLVENKERLAPLFAP